MAETTAEKSCCEKVGLEFSQKSPFLLTQTDRPTPKSDAFTTPKPTISRTSATPWVRGKSFYK